MGTSPNCPKSKSHAHHLVARSVGMKESAWEDSPDPVSFYFHMEISYLRVCEYGKLGHYYSFSAEMGKTTGTSRVLTSALCL